SAGDIPERVDEDPLAVNPGLAVGLAGMVDQPRRVPWDVAIDVPAVGEGEHVHRGVARALGFGMLLPGPLFTLLLVDELSDVLDDLRLRGNIHRCVNTATVDRRSPNLAEITVPPVPEFGELLAQLCFLQHPLRYPAH